MIKNIVKYILTFIILIVIGLGALFAVSFIPQETIEENVKESAQIMVKEGERLEFNSLFRNLYTDNSTNAIMLNLTYTVNSENRLESILMARRNFIPNVTDTIEKDMLR